ncbi:hypothetical protein [Acinetobacter baumannii]|uniref:hypothetical protein n=1 Tax=Acinetobacter baumannii TaxID=470 RepID=UPI000B1AA25A|nr:hypothetical protein [Acinetobacter baumannii]WFT02486.1 hypothetical protein MTS08_13255 [Acinetobacter baumannii]SST72146.1 Uncharacterised protein [Acinetobacter baumannii]
MISQKFLNGSYHPQNGDCLELMRDIPDYFQIACNRIEHSLSAYQPQLFKEVV